VVTIPRANPYLSIHTLTLRYMKDYFLINFPQGNSNGLFAVIGITREGYATLKEQLASVTGTGVKLTNISVTDFFGITGTLVEVPEEGYLGDAMRKATAEGTQMLRQLTTLLAETMAPLDDNEGAWVASLTTCAEGFEFNAMGETDPGDMPLDFRTEMIASTLLGLVAPRDYTSDEYKKIAAVLTRGGQGSTSIKMGQLLAMFDDGNARKFAKGFRKEFDSALCEWSPEMGIGSRYIAE